MQQPVDECADAAREDSEPSEMMVVEDFDQVRVLANDLRVAIIDELIPAPGTVADVARVLQVSPAKLYYHFRELERVGLIRAVPAPASSDPRQHYRATARFYHLSSAILWPDGTPGLEDVGAEFVIGALDHMVGQLRGAFAEQTIARWPDAFIVQRRTARMSLDQARAFRDRLRELVNEFCAADQPNGEVSVAFGFALFPRPGPAAETAAMSARRPRRQRRLARKRPGSSRRRGFEPAGGEITEG